MTMATATTGTFDTASLQALLGPQTDRRAGLADLPAGPRGRRLRSPEPRQAVGRETGGGDYPRSLHAFRADSPLRQAARQRPSQVQGGPGPDIPAVVARRRLGSTLARITPSRLVPSVTGHSSVVDRRGPGLSRTSPPTPLRSSTEHTIARYWCPGCRTTVEPVVPDALPGSTIGLRVVVLSAWLHYLLGTTLSQIIDVFNFHLQFKLSAGGLVSMWHRLREIPPGLARRDSDPGPGQRPYSTPTRPAGESTARPTGCGASRPPI